MDAQDIFVVSGAVVTLTQLIKWGGLPDKLGPASVLLLSLLGVALWVYSSEQPFMRTQLFEYFAGWVTVSTSAAGVFGFTRAAGNTLTELKPPPGGAGQNPTIKGGL